MTTKAPRKSTALTAEQVTRDARQRRSTVQARIDELKRAAEQESPAE